MHLQKLQHNWFLNPSFNGITFLGVFGKIYFWNFERQIIFLKSTQKDGYFDTRLTHFEMKYFYPYYINDTHIQCMNIFRQVSECDKILAFFKVCLIDLTLNSMFSFEKILFSVPLPAQSRLIKSIFENMTPIVSTYRPSHSEYPPHTHVRVWIWPQ
jgi:hypothetical protein